MGLTLTVRGLTTDEEAQQYSQIAAQSFIGAVQTELEYIQKLGLANIRGVFQDHELLGGLALIPMGQWFGGNRVDMTGIGTVAIAPQYRGAGAALQLMQGTLRDLYDSGVALSVLYPATQQLYRRVGYEQSGTYCQWEIATSAIHLRGTPLAVQPRSLADLPLLQSIYRQSFPHNGCLDRHGIFWERLSDAEKTPLIYSFGPDANQPEGYIAFTQSRSSQGTMLTIRDWAVTSAAAIQTLWGFLASHRSQIDRIRWHSGSLDQLTTYLPEQTATPIDTTRWMTRIVRVDQALSQRGYPQSIHTALHLQIQDDLLPENGGAWILRVEQGQGTVTPGGQGDLETDMRGLAMLYTGFWSAPQLRRLGWIRGSDAAIAEADLLFGGESAWMRDFF